MFRIHNPPPHIYGGSGFDRAAERRRDPAWLAARLREPDSRIVPLSGLKVLVDDVEVAPRAVLPRLVEIGTELSDEAVFLGMRGQHAVFAAELGGHPGLVGEFVELRSVGTLLPVGEAGLLAYARALAHWHARHRFCGACGRENALAQGGHARDCAACGNQTFPRTDPAVIVLVTRGDRCILGRADRFPPGMYSTLAGFVEPGESLEETLHREIREEVGIELGGVTYRSSQPWPFPQSLMLGFRADAMSELLRIDPEELEDARWFSRAELRDEARRPVRLPSPDSIARYLIDEWLAERE